MSANPVNAWDRILLVAPESTLGTVPTPASTAAYAALALEVITADLGPAEVGAVRAKRDRGLGRGMQTGWVEGRVEPIPFTVDLSQKSRSAIDAAARESALLKAGGLIETLNSSTNATYSLGSTPIETGSFVPASLVRFLGSGSAAYEAETLRGCLVKTLRWEGGDKELSLRASGAGIGKYVQGAIDSVTLASGVVTTLTHTAEESYRLDAGYYLCESEIIRVANRTDVGVGSTSTTIARAALSSTGAAHSAKALYPYVPTAVAYSGNPIAETTCTVTLASIAARALSWYVELNTGLDHLPGETGSKYRQGVKATRFDVKAGFKLVLSGDAVSLLGKALQRATAGALAASIVQGTGTGAVATFSMPYCEVESFSVSDVVNDVATVDVVLRIRDNASGNNALTLTLT